jgi:hypothetical protein
VRAPDYADALIGWRVWCVVRRNGQLRLASVIADEVWPLDGELVARCRAHEIPGNGLLVERREEHRVPAGDCTCGIYAAREPATVWTYLRGRDEPDTVARVVGRVLLWGRAVEHEDGWRAERAYPLDFYTGDAELRARLRSLFDARRAHRRHARQRSRARGGPR